MTTNDITKWMNNIQVNIAILNFAKVKYCSLGNPRCYIGTPGSFPIYDYSLDPFTEECINPYSGGSINAIVLEFL
jgi:hypothetical protein